MNDVQVWVVIGGMGTLIVGMFGVIPVLFLKEFRGMRGAISALERGLTEQLDALEEKLAEQLDALDEKLVKAHLLGTRPAA